MFLLELTWAGNMLKLFVKKTPMQGKLYVKQAALRLETDYEEFSCQINYEPPETLTFKTVATIAPPALLEIATCKDWRLQRMQVQRMQAQRMQAQRMQAQRIGFLRETRSAAGQFESAIRSGQVVILDTKTKRTLREGDYRIIEKINACQRLEISKAKHRLAGAINAIDDINHKIYVEILSVQPGCSGAPLFSSDGIVGMITMDSGTEIEALNIATIAKIVKNGANPGTRQRLMLHRRLCQWQRQRLRQFQPPKRLRQK